MQLSIYKINIHCLFDYHEIHQIPSHNASNATVDCIQCSRSKHPMPSYNALTTCMSSVMYYTACKYYMHCNVQYSIYPMTLLKYIHCAMWQYICMFREDHVANYLMPLSKSLNAIVEYIHCHHAKQHTMPVM